MKKNYLILFLICLPFLSIGQNGNIFHDRSFWSTNPDVERIKAEIAKGNDPVALTSNAFDGTVNAILANAPLESIKYMLSLEGNEVNKATHDGRNYLMWAANRGNTALMQYLIDKGSDIHIVDDHGYNPMTFAANAGNKNTAVYDLLLANGSKIEDATRSGANALHLLIPSLKDTKLITYFQEKGLDIHAKDKDGNGLFNYAAKKGNIDMMNTLISMGLSYQGLNKVGGNAMMFASRSSRGYTNPVHVFEYLDSLGIESDVVTYEGKTPLHNLSGSSKDPAALEYFINKCVNVNQIDKDGNTALLNAVRGNNMVAARTLAPMSRDINHANEDGYTALTYAVMRSSKEAFDFLMEKGADIKQLDTKGRNLVYHIFNSYNGRNSKAFHSFLEEAQKHGLALTPTYEGGNTLIHLAIAKGHIELLNKALELGVDINTKNKDGLTPLHLAAMKAKNKELLATLLGKGADKTILTDFEESAYDLATENEALHESRADLGFLKID